MNHVFSQDHGIWKISFVGLEGSYEVGSTEHLLQAWHSKTLVLFHLTGQSGLSPNPQIREEERAGET